MHDLVVNAAVYFPKPRLRGVWDEQVARRIRVNSVDLGINHTWLLILRCLGRRCEYLIARDARVEWLYQYDGLEMPLAVRDEVHLDLPGEGEELPVALRLLFRGWSENTRQAAAIVDVLGSITLLIPVSELAVVRSMCHRTHRHGEK